MLPFPLVSFDEQRLEVLQRYRLLAPTSAPNAEGLALLARRALGVEYVYAAVTERHRRRFACHAGVPDSWLDVTASFCARANLAQRPFVLEDVRVQTEIADHPAVSGPPGIRFFAGAPMFGSSGERLGTFCVFSPRPQTLGAERHVLLAQFAGHAAETLSLRSAASYAVRDLVEAERVKRAYYDLAMTDALTGALNRRAFFEVAQRALTRCRRHDRPFAVVMVDIDHFKRVNNEHGNAMGDAVLAALSDCLRRAVRAEDALGRLGGEAFALILPETDREEAARTADRLRRLVRVLPVGENEKAFFVSASFGLAMAGPGEERIEDVLTGADRALYEAKAAGRDRVALHAA
ncbi:GGDEF domain-containing protein [Parvularcula dongshanensis]|uniref:diguanylate cyclase n=1 Tax=Parvularcula dongshanensis TaxID=1173995 RepID=A0A840I075_9PROT|nr:sensor domain-containing diguanylate cyclase [Parvularcula dongshanensis]MBB4658097.1 diguanylate cyclase (GGDEF)-like protein [Parvularcula dongshanensis]